MTFGASQGSLANETLGKLQLNVINQKIFIIGRRMLMKHFAALTLWKLLFFITAVSEIYVSLFSILLGALFVRKFPFNFELLVLLKFL